MELQCNTLEQAKEKCEMEWGLQKLGLYNNIAYAVGLTLAFIIMTMPFMPVPATTMFALGIAGAVLCFTLTVICSALRSGIEIHKSRHSLKAAKQEFERYVAELKDMLGKDPDLNDNEKRFLFLQIKKFQAESEYQKRMIVYQSVQLVRSVMIEAMIPAIVFASLVFFPLGIGLAAIGGALGLAIASHFLINALFKPSEKMKELAPFDDKKNKADEMEYKAFCKLIEKEGATPKEHHAFFKKKENASSKSPEDDLSLDGDARPAAV